MLSNRRLFLRGLSALPVLGAATVAPAVSKASASVENPALLAWGARLDGLLNAWRVADAALDDAVARYHELYPVPEELVATAVDQRVGLWGRREQSWRGRWMPGERSIITLRELQDKRYRTDGRTAVGKWVIRKLRIAEAYEAAREPAEEATGIWDAQEAFQGAQSAIDAAVQEVMELSAVTLAGIALKAKAMVVHGHTAEGLPATWVTVKYGNEFAAEIVRIAT
jgi:hypothetical protein